jgi:cytochrome c peroxidase
MKVYFNKAKCDQCHEGINFTTNAYHNLGVGAERNPPEEGRYAVTKDPKDMGAFKTPTLRDLTRTAPYMHDGSLATIEDVVAFYNKGGNWNKNLDERIKPLKLSNQDFDDLVAFLKSLTGTEGWQHAKAPESFPQ